MRLLVTEHGWLLTLVELFESERYGQASLSWQSKVARAVGLLYDYCKVVPMPEGRSARSRYLSRFVGVLMSGTVDKHGDDPTGLYWPPSSFNGVQDIVMGISTFSDFCVDRYSSGDWNPVVEANFSERLAKLRALDLANQNSLLKHIKSRRTAYARASERRTVAAPRAPLVRTSEVPAFPQEHFDALLNKGFEINPKAREPWIRWNLRDIMIALLQRHGGLRGSETLHIYTQDVAESRIAPGMAQVSLYHPEKGAHPWINPLTQKVELIQRIEYLRLQYQRVPRSQMTGGERVNWKDLMLDEGAPHWLARVHWFPASSGELFWELYKMYVSKVIPMGLEHPYLFMNLRRRDGAHGAPYRLKTYARNLKRAVEKIGLESSKRMGTSPHGLRHRYAQDLTDAGVDRKIIQVCLHHKSILSQDVYTRAEVHDARRALDAAVIRLKSGLVAAPSGHLVDNPTILALR